MKLFAWIGAVLVPAGYLTWLFDITFYSQINIISWGSVIGLGVVTFVVTAGLLAVALRMKID